ncbi:MAG: 37S ribosomal protein S9, mitochondrial [Trizodia sp. TS-e1964]|nr:MAG: 37S ribosomal protein S9, mitochondrial [Trizodia sp. TS-e1964]
MKAPLLSFKGGGSWLFRPVPSTYTTYLLRSKPTFNHGTFRALTTSSPDRSIAAPPISHEEEKHLANDFRVVPASASYFSAKPDFTDNLLELQSLLRKNQTLPVVAPGLAPRTAWKTLAQYRVLVGEPVKATKYHKILQILHRLNHIHPSLVSEDVKSSLAKYKRAINPHDHVAKVRPVDRFGRTIGLGRRKSAHARAWLVEGEGEVLVNGKPLSQAFARIHDRESTIWPLKATSRIDKYNVWALVSGGGTTGQAEALTLAVARALLIHEPALKPALRRGKLACCHPHYQNPLSIRSHSPYMGCLF